MNTQRGVVMVVCLVFLLLLSLLAVSSMQNATLQEKVAGSLRLRDATFQQAEALLRQGELQTFGSALPACSTPAQCLPPAEALTLTTGGMNGRSGIDWVATQGGFYGIQHLGETDDPTGVEPGPPDKTWTLHRITAVATQGTSRTVLESVYSEGQRILWRQRQ
ncbi:PilX N-terminal domain-containing pilus assembly protein [Pseudomonas sp. NPDC090202]|uniref:pilus assembly PilX family protein n=1 Tax=unclassified Pseudomonas TaxID=196821 RepID=UPI00381B2681